MIFWFSGTGNSAAVARMLAGLTGDSAVRIDASVPRRFTTEADERIVWVFPVYSWGVPPVVRRFMREVDFGGNRGLHSMVCTCGDDCGMTFSQWTDEIHSRGWRRGGGYSVTMPNTYVALPGFNVDSPTLAAEKLRLAPDRVREIARAIRHDAKVTDMVRGSLPRLKTYVVYPFFTRFLMNPARFRATDACIGCGKCAAVCPMANISMTDGSPYWGDNCAGCLACYHACPQHAVDWGRLTASKGQYSAPKSLE